MINESRIRRRVRKTGFIVRKSGARNLTEANSGEYVVRGAFNGLPVLGSHDEVA